MGREIWGLEPPVLSNAAYHQITLVLVSHKDSQAKEQIENSTIAHTYF